MSETSLVLRHSGHLSTRIELNITLLKECLTAMQFDLIQIIYDIVQSIRDRQVLLFLGIASKFCTPWETGQGEWLI